MTEDQALSLRPLADLLDRVFEECGTLKQRLPSGIKEIKTLIPVDQNQKKLLSAAKSLLSQAASTYKELNKGLNISQKDMMAMTIAQFKLKWAKCMKSSSSASDWGMRMYSAYQDLIKSGWTKPSSMIHLPAGFNHAKIMMECVTSAKINYAILQ